MTSPAMEVRWPERARWDRLLTSAAPVCREAYRVIKEGGLACMIGPVHPTFWLSRMFADAWMLFPTEQEYLDVRYTLILPKTLPRTLAKSRPKAL